MQDADQPNGQAPQPVLQQQISHPETKQELKNARLPKDNTPTNLIELERHVSMVMQNQYVKDQHKLSTASLPTLPVYDVQDQRRVSTVSQPASSSDYVQPLSSVEHENRNCSSQQTQVVIQQSTPLQPIVEQQVPVANDAPDENVFVCEEDVDGNDDGQEFSDQVSEHTTSTSDNTSQGKTQHKVPSKRFNVHAVYVDGTVECQLLCKQKTVSFKFNRFDTQATDIIEGLVRDGYLKPGSHKTLTKQLIDILRQLDENPNKMPDCVRYVQKVSPMYRCLGRITLPAMLRIRCLHLTVYVYL